MTPRPILLAMLPALLPLAAPAPARELADGPLGTLRLGRYLCELPGDALGPATQPVADQRFEVIIGSSYVMPDGAGGTYLRTGSAVVFTRGPMLGHRFMMESENALRQLDQAGAPSSVRCVYSGRSDNSTSAASAVDRG